MDASFDAYTFRTKWGDYLAEVVLACADHVLVRVESHANGFGCVVFKLEKDVQTTVDHEFQCDREQQRAECVALLSAV